MRYAENKDQSGELLRLALPLMARQFAALHPVSEKLEARAQEVGMLTQQLERAQSEALLDPLTGLKNRRGFDRAVQETLRPARPW